MRTASLRFPDNLYKEMMSLAKKNHLSLNALIRQKMGQAVIEAKREALRKGAKLLAEHPEMCDIEWAIPAQREALDMIDDEWSNKKS